jgi:putative exosortase-associated protein (TIGR04073 family)
MDTRATCSRWTCRLALAVVFAGLAATAQAEEGPRAAYVKGSLRKLGRGATNVVTCPVEILRSIEHTGRQDGYLAAATVGPLHGLWHGVVRGLAGAFEVLTFYADIPKGSGFAPLVQPEFVLGDWGWFE